MLAFLADQFASWTTWRLDRLPPRSLRVLNTLFVALCLVATGLFVVALLALPT